MIDVIGLLLLMVFIASIGFLYFRNAYLLIRQLNTKEYGIIMISRVIGIFFPLWGIVMSFVKETQ